VVITQLICCCSQQLALGQDVDLVLETSGPRRAHVYSSLPLIILIWSPTKAKSSKKAFGRFAVLIGNQAIIERGCTMHSKDLEGWGYEQDVRWHALAPVAQELCQPAVD